MRSFPPYVAVCGAGVAAPEMMAVAEEVGRGLARRGAVVVGGGMTGIMEASSRGAKEAGGTTVGILPGQSRSDANDFVDIAIPTGLGEMRNGLIVRAADAVIAIAGEFGTLSEIALALKTNVPVVAIDTWRLFKGERESEDIRYADTPEQAVTLALELLR